MEGGRQRRKRRADEALGEESVRGMVAFFAGIHRNDVVMLGGIQSLAAEDRTQRRRRTESHELSGAGAGEDSERAQRLRRRTARTGGEEAHGVSGGVDERTGVG